LPSMQNSRQGAVVIELNNELYVIGGVSPEFYEDIVTSFRYNLPAVKLSFSSEFVEKYNPINKKWTLFASLNQPRITHSVGVFSDNIYVIGGFSREVEQYDPTKKYLSVRKNFPFEYEQ